MIDVKDAEVLLLISKALDLGLIGSIQKEDGAIVISHIDGEILSFEPCLNDLKIYLAGLLKSWDLICCGMVVTQQIKSSPSQV